MELVTVLALIVTIAVTVGLFVATTRKRRKAIEAMTDQRDVDTLVLKGEDLGTVQSGESRIEPLPESEPEEEVDEEESADAAEPDEEEPSLQIVESRDSDQWQVVLLSRVADSLDSLGKDVKAQNRFLNQLAKRNPQATEVTPAGSTVITDVSPVVEAIENLRKDLANLSLGEAPTKVISPPPAEVMVSVDPGFDTIKVLDIPVKKDPDNHEKLLNALLDEGWRLITATPMSDPGSALPEVRYVFGAKKENS